MSHFNNIKKKYYFMFNDNFDYYDDEKEIDYSIKPEDLEPKNAHGVQFDLNLNSEDADIIRKALAKSGHVKLADKLEIKRELSIMHEVMDCEGYGILGKVDNCLEKWRKANDYNVATNSREPKYKMVHRVLAK